MEISKRKNKRRKRKKKILFVSFLLIGIFSFSFIVYGEGDFYCIKTFLYKNQALKINIDTERNNNLENLNLNFKNNGSCNVYLRGFVFVYPKNNQNSGTILSNSAVKINYGDERSWFVGDDNYVYYTKPLDVGDQTKNPMVESVEINLSYEDKRILKECEFKIDIVMEAVQVNNFAYKYQWDMSNMDLQDYFNKAKQDEGKTLEKNSIINIKFD
ncbi:hypothetical protein [Terrisporobacter sp.]